MSEQQVESLAKTQEKLVKSMLEQGVTPKSADTSVNTNSDATKNNTIDPQYTGASTETPSASVVDKESEAYGDPDTDVFYLDVMVFLEGVQVPHTQCAVSYGVGEPPSCTVIIPATNFLRELPATTKITIVHKDLMPDENGVYQWRLLFDGELSGYSYSIDPSGANMTIHGIHCASYLTLMQMMCQEVREYLNDPNQQTLGNSICLKQSSGFNAVQVKLLAAIFNKQKTYIKSMADVVYLLLRYLIVECAKYTKAGASVSSASKWYNEKLGNEPGGYKILKRIYGVSDAALNAAELGDYTKNFNGTGGSDGDYKGGSGITRYNYDTANRIFSYFTKDASPTLSIAATCAIMGNMQLESGLDPAAKQDGGPAIGLIQWEKDRKTNMMEHCLSYGDKLSWETNVEGQCDFVMKELSSSEYQEGGAWPIMPKLLNVVDSAEACANLASDFMSMFERPSITHEDQRRNNAINFYNEYSNRALAQANGEASGDISTNDLKTITFDRGSGGIGTLKAFDSKNVLIKSYEASGDFYSPGSDGVYHTQLAPGTYTVGNAEFDDTDPSYGWAYIHLQEASTSGKHIHGGGSGLSNPHAPRQGWLGTYGCTRMQNIDVKELAQMVARSKNKISYIVTGIAQDLGQG